MAWQLLASEPRRLDPNLPMLAELLVKDHLWFAEEEICILCTKSPVHYLLKHVKNILRERSIACNGIRRSSPTMSVTFSSKIGSFETLKAAVRRP